jgi:hypothetical protein
VIHPDPSSSSISHPSGGADTNRYSSNSFFRRLVPVMGNAVNQLANDHLQDMSGFVFHFCIRLQIAMSTRVLQRTLLKNIKFCVNVCCYGKFRSH